MLQFSSPARAARGRQASSTWKRLAARRQSAALVFSCRCRAAPQARARSSASALGGELGGRAADRGAVVAEVAQVVDGDFGEQRLEQVGARRGRARRSRAPRLRGLYRAPARAVSRAPRRVIVETENCAASSARSAAAVPTDRWPRLIAVSRRRAIACAYCPGTAVRRPCRSWATTARRSAVRPRHPIHPLTLNRAGRRQVADLRAEVSDTLRVRRRRCPAASASTRAPAGRPRRWSCLSVGWGCGENLRARVHVPVAGGRGLLRCSGARVRRRAGPPDDLEHRDRGHRAAARRAGVRGRSSRSSRSPGGIYPWARRLIGRGWAWITRLDRLGVDRPDWWRASPPVRWSSSARCSASRRPGSPRS